MEKEQLLQLIEQGGLPGRILPYRIVETHISLVLLTPDYAFKFKKEVNLGFLDFSSLEKRHYYCIEELRLNQRLATGMYLKVVPVLQFNGRLYLGEGMEGEVIDYAVQMKRMDESYQLDELIKQDAVSVDDLHLLAIQLATFHLANRIQPSMHYQSADTKADFNDLFRFQGLVSACLGDGAGVQLQQIGERLSAFFERFGPRLEARVSEGFWVEGHGDLHTRNIFLLPGMPVVFDCIEFSLHFRQLDVLSELAFLCMDLDFQDRKDLGELFLRAYQSHWAVLPTPEDEVLFRFFKAYRANVRLKVILLQWDSTGREESLREVAQRYFQLMMEEMPDPADAVGCG